MEKQSNAMIATTKPSETLLNYSALLKQVAKYYRLELDPVQLAMDVKLLSKHPLEQVRIAIEAHIADGKSCQFYPKAGQLIERIVGNGEVVDLGGFKPTKVQDECPECNGAGWKDAKRVVDKNSKVTRCGCRAGRK